MRTSARRRIPSPQITVDSGGASSSVIDLGCLYELFGGDPQLVNGLLDIFRSSITALSGRLHAAVEQFDAEAVRRLALEARDSCGSLGIQAMAEIAADMEGAAASQDWEFIMAMCHKFDAAFQQIDGTVLKNHSTMILGPIAGDSR